MFLLLNSSNSLFYSYHMLWKGFLIFSPLYMLHIIMVDVRIFLVARFLPLFIVLNIITNKIAFIGIIIVVLEATLAISQKDIKKIWSFPQLSCISSCYGILSNHFSLFDYLCLLKNIAINF